MIRAAVFALGRGFHGLITEADNRTVSVFRVVGVVVIAHMCGLQYVDTVMNSHPFDPNAFGLGVTGVLAAVGVSERVAHYCNGKDENA
jgi:hypothetical protein